MKNRNAICIVVDGLRASALGAYGNTWYSTPSLNRLAARSTVVDWLLVDSPELELFYRGVWRGLAALRPRSLVGSDAAGLSLPQLFAEAGVRQTVVTDDLWFDQQAAAMSVDDLHWLDASAAVVAEAIEDTALGRLFSTVIERLDEWPTAGGPDSAGGQMLWIHSRGMHGPWDAPWAIRQSLVDEGDPPPPRFVEPPQKEVGNDPDQWLGVRIAYAAQAIVLDACVGAVVAALDESGQADSTLLMLVGSRGFALGEHGEAGTACGDLFGEVLHVPWLVCAPNATSPTAVGSVFRFAGLTQPADIGSTLLDWFGILAAPHLLSDGPFSDGQSLLPAFSDILSDWRQFVVARGDRNQRAIRTPAWMLRQTPGEQGSTQLYTKPDDRWEMNDVAVRCPEATEQLLAVLAEHEQRCASPIISLPEKPVG